MEKKIQQTTEYNKRETDSQTSGYPWEEGIGEGL